MEIHFQTFFDQNRTFLVDEKHGPAEAEPLFSFVSECLDRIEVGSLVARQDAEQDADSH